MKNLVRFKVVAARLHRHRLGNFSMMTAIFLPVLLGGAGIAIDLTNVVKTKAALQEATDTAALSAAAALANNGFTTEEATLLALKFLGTQMSDSQKVESEGEEDISSKSVVDITQVATAGTDMSYKVVVRASHKVTFTPFTRLSRPRVDDIERDQQRR